MQKVQRRRDQTFGFFSIDRALGVGEGGGADG
jgi:hypothetical protein